MNSFNPPPSPAQIFATIVSTIWRRHKNVIKPVLRRAQAWMEERHRRQRRWRRRRRRLLEQAQISRSAYESGAVLAAFCCTESNTHQPHHVLCTCSSSLLYVYLCICYSFLLYVSSKNTCL